MSAGVYSLGNFGSASTSDDIMLYDDETAEDADTETTEEDVTVNA